MRSRSITALRLYRRQSHLQSIGRDAWISRYLIPSLTAVPGLLDWSDTGGPKMLDSRIRVYIFGLLDVDCNPSRRWSAEKKKGIRKKAITEHAPSNRRRAILPDTTHSCLNLYTYAVNIRLWQHSALHVRVLRIHRVCASRITPCRAACRPERRHSDPQAARWCRR